MEVSSSIVDLVHLFHMSCMQLALQTLESIKDRGTANRSRSTASGFNAAARSSNTAVVACTRIAASDLGSAAWAALSEKAANMIVIQHNIDTLDHKMVGWIDRAEGGKQVTVRELPSREQIDVPVREQLIVELYSK